MTDEDLRFNVMNHRLVPLHELVPEDEVPSILERYRIGIDQLPKIRSDDAACRVIGAKSGSVVRITRDSPTAGHSVAYRLVVEAI